MEGGMQGEAAAVRAFSNSLLSPFSGVERCRTTAIRGGIITSLSARDVAICVGLSTNVAHFHPVTQADRCPNRETFVRC